MPVRSHTERAARIICRRAGAPFDLWPTIADSFAVANLALQLACRDLVRAASREIMHGTPGRQYVGLLPPRA